MTTVQAAREAWLLSAHEAEAGWSDVDSRRERYSLLWRYYENDLYDDLAAYKASRGLYRYIRPIYNPVARLVDFYVSKVWGGGLDPQAMGGAIPIETANDALREAIAQLWQWSNWAARKNLAVRWGACLGDMVIKIVDDREQQKCYLQVMHPRMIKGAQFDWRGNITSAIIEYTDSEPSETQAGVYVDFTYKEVITKERFSTYKNDEPYDYFGYGAEWYNPYGFVPLILGVHKDVGLDWGLSCFQAGLPTIDELNDQASVFSDRMRKGNNPAWLMAGVSKPRSGDIDLSATTATTTDKTQRQTDNLLYGPEGARAQALVSDIGMAESMANVTLLLEETERNFPELALHRLRQQRASVSGVALSILYQDVLDRVVEARGNYDAALVRAQQMAISIGGLRGYFPGFRLESYEAGDEEHRIGERVILTQAQDWRGIEMAIQTGVPNRLLWPKLGLDFSEEELQEMEAEEGTQEGEEGTQITESDHAQARADLDALRGVLDGGGE